MTSYLAPENGILTLLAITTVITLIVYAVFWKRISRSWTTCVLVAVPDLALLALLILLMV